MKFSGKLYQYHNSYDTKSEAKRNADGLRYRGLLARVVYQRPRKRFGNRTYSGKPWAVYVRKGV